MNIVLYVWLKINLIMKTLLLKALMAISICSYCQSTRLFLEYNYIVVELSNGDIKEGNGTNSFILDLFKENDVVHVNDRGNVVTYKMIKNTLFEVQLDSNGVKYREAIIRDSLGAKISLVLLNDGEQVMFLFFPDFTIRFEVK